MAWGKEGFGKALVSKEEEARDKVYVKDKAFFSVSI